MGKAQLRRAFNIAAAVLVIALVVGLYKAKSDAAHTEAHVRELEAKIADGEADLRALRAEIARRESPANIEALAEQHLGLTIGGQAEALPEAALDRRLPEPRADQPK